MYKPHVKMAEEPSVCLVEITSILSKVVGTQSI